ASPGSRRRRRERPPDPTTATPLAPRTAAGPATRPALRRGEVRQATGARGSDRSSFTLFRGRGPTISRCVTEETENSLRRWVPSCPSDHWMKGRRVEGREE